MRRSVRQEFRGARRLAGSGKVGGGAAKPRLTPQLPGKAVHIIKFPWVSPPIASHPWKAATVTVATRTGLGDRIPDKRRKGSLSDVCSWAPPSKDHLYPDRLAPHIPTLCTPSPNSAVRQPTSITVVKAILKSSL